MINAFGVFSETTNGYTFGVVWAGAITELSVRYTHVHIVLCFNSTAR